MKIAVCGKGGVGKSTVSVLLANQFAKQGKKVLIIDTDESNYGLHKELGVELPKDFMEYFGGKMSVIMNMGDIKNFTEKFFKGTWTMDDIPEGYYAQKDGIKLIANGKIHVVGEGCACPMNVVLGELLSNLRMGEDEICMMDMDAGIEHFGRGVDNGADVILMVVDPSYESGRLSKKIAELAAEIGKPIYYVMNKVTDKNREAMYAQVADPSKVVLEVLRTAEIETAGMLGQDMTGMEAQVEHIENIFDKITV